MSASSDTKLLDPSSENCLKHDVPAGTVVFLVALPLCLGIALGSGTPLFAGIIAGIVGGVVVGTLSGSNVSVSGPAAGLVVIVVATLRDIGSYQGFLAAVVFSGLMQLVFGLLRLGVIADYVPSAVIKGMLAGIGVQIVLKQVPHALGRDADYMGHFSFLEPGGNTMFSDIARALSRPAIGAVLIFAASLTLLLVWDRMGGKWRVFRVVPAPLAVVALGIALNSAFGNIAHPLHLSSRDHLVNLPTPAGLAEFLAQFTLPHFSAIADRTVWTAALTIAIVGSLETLLSLEAADRLDPYRRTSSPNRELFAQGAGNVVSGLIGGLPVTSVVVRTAANVEAGGRTRISTIIHGFLILLSSILLPRVLNLTPLASLATILIVVGLKLTKPSLYREMFSQGWAQFLPFVMTLLAVVFVDLLTGVLIGMAFGLFFVIRTNHHEAITVVNKESNYLLRFNKDASFINKNEFKRKLRGLPKGSDVVITGARALFVDHDIKEIIEDFRTLAPYKNIHVELKHWESSHR